MGSSLDLRPALHPFPPELSLPLRLLAGLLGAAPVSFFVGDPRLLFELKPVLLAGAGRAAGVVGRCLTGSFGMGLNSVLGEVTELFGCSLRRARDRELRLDFSFGGVMVVASSFGGLELVVFEVVVGVAASEVCVFAV